MAITDSGTPRMTGVSILHVVIGDKNDNPMAPGHSNIFVYNYRVCIEAFVFILTVDS